MTFLECITAVLNGEPADRVPFAPYDNLVPRGDFERELRNRGMGMLLRRGAVWSEVVNIGVEHRTEGNFAYTVYHTPVGSVQEGRQTHVGRIADGESIAAEWLIKGREDFAPVISMIDNTAFHADYPAFRNQIRDVGSDGLVRLDGFGPPYDSTSTYFSLEDWAAAQYDYPEEFARLLAAVERRVERLAPLLLEAPGTLMSMGSLSGIYGPVQYRQYALPFYQRYVPQFQAAGKPCALHAHNSNLTAFADLVKQTGVAVVEAFTPPPVGDLSLADARALWGPEVVIWVNFPETLFLLGKQATYDYTVGLLKEDGGSGRLVIGMTEMGSYGIMDDESERQFKEGMRAIMDAIEAAQG